MSDDRLLVFFYGLFMDESLLASRGVSPSGSVPGYVDGYSLRIGQRATLQKKRGGRAYGVLMTITGRDAAALYSDASVADYVPEPVTVTLASGAIEQAVCYNLPLDKLEGSNAAYAGSLLQLATRLGFPDEYLETIRKEGGCGDVRHTI